MAYSQAVSKTLHLSSKPESIGPSYGELRGRKFIPASNGNHGLCNLILLLPVLVIKGMIFWVMGVIDANPEMVIVGQVMFGIGMTPILLTVILGLGCKLCRRKSLPSVD